MQTTEVPTTDPQITEPQTTEPHRVATWWYIVIALLIIGGAYLYFTQSKPAELPSTSTDADPVADQLRSVSEDTDTTTIKNEINATTTSDIAPELDAIAAETEGL